jgi:hypothetical protein
MKVVCGMKYTSLNTDTFTALCKILTPFQQVSMLDKTIKSSDRSFFDLYIAQQYPEEGFHQFCLKKKNVPTVHNDIF